MLLQIAAAQQEAGGKPVPFFLQLPNSCERVPTASAVALTGCRFLNTFALGQAGSGNAIGGASTTTPHAVQTVKPKSEPKPTCKRQCTGSRKHDTRDPVAADDMTDEEAEAGMLRLLAAVMREDAPTALSVQDAYHLVAACQYNLAHELMAYLPTYLSPLLKTAPAAEVRNLLHIPTYKVVVQLEQGVHVQF